MSFHHDQEKKDLSTDDYYHCDEYLCQETGKSYCLKHLHSYRHEFYDEKYDQKYMCKVKYRTHVYTKGAKHFEIVDNVYDRSKVINIESGKKKNGIGYDEYRFFSKSRYILSLELNKLLDKCYNNQVRLNVETYKKNEYTALPYFKSTDPNKNYCIFLRIFKKYGCNTINIQIESAYIETRQDKVNKRTKPSVKKIGLKTILRKLNGTKKAT